ncbi:MAG: glycosyltransferase family protein [Thermoleophilaceae bacterium]
MPDRLASAHIGLAPYAPDSPSSFSPLKLFEYLAAGLAVVAADLPGVSDIVDSETAMLIPPGDGVALAEAVQALAADPARRAALGRAGRARVVAEHTWERRARDILAHFEELSARAAYR